MKIGLELELPDILTTIPIPPEIGVYNYKEATIVNSCGIANDPLKKDIFIGSEINMTPVTTVKEMVNNIERLYNILPGTCTNFNSGLHVHISMPGLSTDFKKLYDLHVYTFYYGKTVFNTTCPVYEKYKEGTHKERDKKIQKYRRYEFTLDRKQHILTSKTWEDIRDRQQPLHGTRRLTHLARRCSINIRSLWDNGTVEFRHFFGTDNLSEYESAIEWCIMYLNEAIGAQRPVEELIKSREWKFPEIPIWDEDLHLGWKQTNFKDNKRPEVLKRLSQLVQEGKVPEYAVSKRVLKYKG